MTNLIRSAERDGTADTRDGWIGSALIHQIHAGRVTAGDHSPAVPTDPDVRVNVSGSSA